MKSVEEGGDTMAIPFLALVETAAVGARLTGQAGLGREAVCYVRSHATLLSDVMIHDESVDVACETKASGFDSVFIACARMTESVLVTDDKKMHQAALDLGVESRLLRDM